ncbi:MAG: GGDEF domain-containing protein [Acidimicrobiales bacterium]
MTSEVPPKGKTTKLPRLSDRWAKCSEGRDASEYSTSSEARSLASEVETSLSHGKATSDLSRTAKTWGRTLPSPTAVVSAVAALREAVSRRSEGDQAIRPGVLRILDDVLAGAIDGVSAGLREAALVDPLTGCSNRRALKEDLERAAAGSRRTGLDVAVAVVDLDGLKQINDTYGHAAGDATLKHVAESLRSVIRDTDVVYRVGGDEFVVVIPYSSATGAAAAMRRALAEGAPMFSWGVASLGMLEPGTDIEKLIELADASLYANRRNVRPIAHSPHRRRRKALVVGAAAATLGIGLSAYALEVPTEHGAVGAPSTNGSVTGPTTTSGTGSGAESRHQPRSHTPAHATSVPPPVSGSPPAPGKAVGTGGSQTGAQTGSQVTGSGAGTVSATTPPSGTTTSASIPIVLTAVALPTTASPKKKPKTVSVSAPVSATTTPTSTTTTTTGPPPTTTTTAPPPVVWPPATSVVKPGSSRPPWNGGGHHGGGHHGGGHQASGHGSPPSWGWHGHPETGSAGNPSPGGPCGNSSGAGNSYGAGNGYGTSSWVANDWHSEGFGTQRP